MQMETKNAYVPMREGGDCERRGREERMGILMAENYGADYSGE